MKARRTEDIPNKLVLIGGRTGSWRDSERKKQLKSCNGVP